MQKKTLVLPKFHLWSRFYREIPSCWLLKMSFKKDFNSPMWYNNQSIHQSLAWGTFSFLDYQIDYVLQV